MSETPQEMSTSQIVDPPPTDRSPNRNAIWRSFVVPTAKGLEGLAWRIAWFAVLVKILFFTWSRKRKGVP